MGLQSVRYLYKYNFFVKGKLVTNTMGGGAVRYRQYSNDPSISGILLVPGVINILYNMRAI